MKPILVSERGTVICRVCGEEKDTALFPTRRQRKAGIDNECKRCCRNRRKKHYYHNGGKEKTAAYVKARIASDPSYRDKMNSKSKERYQKKGLELRAYSRKYYHERVTSEKRLWQGAKHRAARSGLPFNIEPSDFSVPDLCPLLGIPLTHGPGKIHDNSPSLDRLVPSLGYVKGNIIVISYRANRIKQNSSPEELELLAKNLRDLLNNR
jgi:hypothetical protein